ncbi:hypothetical protein DUB66_24970 [Salmonella enterica subsp. enterica]|nr:hypothetical protein [Salmonella enterica subsp. enterica serovar Livingstone]
MNLGPEVQCKNDSVQPAPSGSAAISVRSNLKTRTSLKAVSTIHGQDQNCQCGWLTRMKCDLNPPV